MYKVETNSEARELKLVEQMLADGQTSKVHSFILEQHSNAGIKFSKRVWLAELSRRISRYYLGLRVLKPMMQERDGGVSRMSLDGQISLANLYTRIGAPQYSLRILRGASIDSEEAIRAEALSYIYLWEYDKAIPLFQTLLERLDSKSYAYGVAQINLLAAYGFLMRTEEAYALFDLCMENFVNNKWDLLKFNAHEIMSGIHIHAGHLNKADNEITQALCLGIAESNMRYKVLLEKWMITLRAIKKPCSENFIAFSGLKEKAKGLSIWNTVREIEALYAQVTGDIGTAERVYAGSPFQLYREQLVARMPWFTPKQSYIRCEIASPQRVFSLMGACEIGSDFQITPDSVNHHLIKVLNSDFYRTLPMGEVFYNLFPDQYFDPDTSPRRIYVAIQRLRSLFVENSVPIEVIQKGNSVTISGSEPGEAYGFLVHSNLVLGDKITSTYDALKFRVNRAYVTNEDIQLSLRIGRSASTKFIQKSLKQKFFKKKKIGREVQYYFLR